MLHNKKGISLILLVITIIVMIIIATTIIISITNSDIIDKANEATTKTEIANIKEQLQLDILNRQAINGTILSNLELKTILEKYGTINYEEDETTIKSITTTKNNHEILLSEIYKNPNINEQSDSYEKTMGSGNWNGTINTPKIYNTGLIPVFWDETSSEWVELNSISTEQEWANWYDYDNKKWANAKSADGSMWVWIPRYAYTINNTNKTIGINFVKIGDTIPEGYTLHPAFGTDIENGGWDKELPGFWVSKYAAGYQNGTVGEPPTTVVYSNLNYTSISINTCNFLCDSLNLNTKLSYPVFKANTYAYNLISVGDSWLLSQQIDTSPMYGLRNIDSHLEKNSEWGAVSYLAHSAYGLNGKSTAMNEITINSKNLNNSIYVNNISGGKKANVYAITSYANRNIANDTLASSTKNMTGVFDLNGCIWERVAGYNKGENTSTAIWHSSMATSETTQSTKYVTLYTTNTKKGDATNETASWNKDYATFIDSTYPIVNRGGRYESSTSAGMFSFNRSSGSPGLYDGGFRVCLAF